MPLHSDDLDWIRGFCLRYLAGHGTEAVVDDATDLRCADGTVYRFEEIVRLCASTTRGNWTQAISGHLDALMALRSDLRIDDLTSAELDMQVRARVLPTASIAVSANGFAARAPHGPRARDSASPGQLPMTHPPPGSPLCPGPGRQPRW